MTQQKSNKTTMRHRSTSTCKQRPMNYLAEHMLNDEFPSTPLLELRQLVVQQDVGHLEPTAGA